MSCSASAERIAHRTAHDAAYRVAVEKDNSIPSVDLRASGHEKRSQCKQSHSPHEFIADREKGSQNAEVFCIGKNERK
jgi:hypothetical protein